MLPSMPAVAGAHYDVLLQASLENRKLSLDLAGLLLAWEQRRRETPQATGQAAVTGSSGQIGGCCSTASAIRNQGVWGRAGSWLDCSCVANDFGLYWLQLGLTRRRCLHVFLLAVH
jgi:hypothetical protein